MKVLFWIGILFVVLGVLSLFVPISHTEREGFSAGGVKFGVETKHNETVSPFISAALILGGAGMMIAGKMGK
jgi:hypothetical protein